MEPVKGGNLVNLPENAKVVLDGLKTQSRFTMTGTLIIITMWCILGAERRKPRSVSNAASVKKPARSIFTSVNCWLMWQGNLKIAK